MPQPAYPRGVDGDTESGGGGKAGWRTGHTEGSAGAGPRESHHASHALRGRGPVGQRAGERRAAFWESEARLNESVACGVPCKKFPS